MQVLLRKKKMRITVPRQKTAQLQGMGRVVAADQQNSCGCLFGESYPTPYGSLDYQIREVALRS